MKPAVPGGKAHAAVGERVDVRGVGGWVSRDPQITHAKVICGSSRQRAAVSQQQAERTLPGYPSWQHISKRGAWARKEGMWWRRQWRRVRTGKEHEDVGLAAGERGVVGDGGRGQREQQRHHLWISN